MVALTLKIALIIFSTSLAIIGGAYSYFEQQDDRTMHLKNQQAIIGELEQIRKELETLTGSNVNPITGQP